MPCKAFQQGGSMPILWLVYCRFKHRVKVWLRGMQYRARAEHCFATAPKQRIRIVHQLKLLDAGWQVLAIEVHRERWEADYNGGAELAGKSNQINCRKLLWEYLQRQQTQQRRMLRVLKMACRLRRWGPQLFRAAKDGSNSSFWWLATSSLAFFRVSRGSSRYRVGSSSRYSCSQIHSAGLTTEPVNAKVKLIAYLMITLAYFYSFLVSSAFFRRDLLGLRRSCTAWMKVSMISQGRYRVFASEYMESGFPRSWQALSYCGLHSWWWYKIYF